MRNLVERLRAVAAEKLTPMDRAACYETEAAERIIELEGKLGIALDRMDRARGILTNDNPRPECNWGILDTSDLRGSK